MKTKVESSSETLVAIYESTNHHMPEDLDLQFQYSKDTRFDCKHCSLLIILKINNRNIKCTLNKMTNFKVTGTAICVTTTKALILIPK
jgi:hypothetical protein